MNRIILASHSKLASGMAETIRFFGGGEVEVLEQELRDTGFDARAEAILSRYANENCIVFTDLYGGSVNQCFFRLLAKYHFHLITGMNLAVILECMFSAQKIDEAFIHQAMEGAHQQFAYMNDVLKQALCDEDEDD